MKRKLYLFILILVILTTGCSNTSKSELVNLSANFIGDSITEHGVYPKKVKKQLGLSNIKNYGIGGSSLCLRHNQYDVDYIPLVERWESIEEADIHFILIGTNDYSSSVPIGDIDSVNKGEFNGCLNIVLSGLKEKFPDDLIIISTILKRKDNGVPIKLPEYNEAIKLKVEEYNLVLFDGYNLEGLDIGNDYDGEITKDRLHPNKKGANLLGQGISNFLNQLLQRGYSDV